MRLQVRDLRKCYGSLEAVAGISLEIAAGEVFGLLGPNGAGKTTALRAIVGLIEPDEGTIVVDGIDRRVASRAAKRRIGHVPDRPYVAPRLTGREYLEYLAGLYDVPHSQARPRIATHLARFGLESVADRLVETYSHGMKQKLALGALFIHDPSLLVVDEPMVGLDAAAQALVRRLLVEEAARGKAVLLTTHTLSVAESTCHRVSILGRGRILVSGSPTAIATDAGRPGHPLEEIFLELVREDA